MSFQSVLTVEQRQRYSSVFVELDQNGDGWMSREEMSRWLSGEGHNLSNQAMEAIFRLIDTDQNGRITLDEFFAVMEMVNQPPQEHMVKEVFTSMDTNGDGYLSEEELLLGLKNMGYTDLTRQQIRKFAFNLDRDGDGKISYSDFLNALCPEMRDHLQTAHTE